MGESTPERNGYFERRHRHIVKMGLTLLSHASLPLIFWSQAFATTIYLINRLPANSLGISSLYKSIFGTAPNYSKLKIFGCLCYPWLRPYSSHKLDPRSKPCIFLGYSSSQHAYLCFDPTSTKIFISRHVKFVESVFPHKSLHHQLPRSDSTTIPSWIPPILHVSVPQPTLLVQHTPSAECPQEL